MEKGQYLSLDAKKSARQWKGGKGGRAWGMPLMLTMVSCSDLSNISNVLNLGFHSSVSVNLGKDFELFFFC